MIVLFCLNRQKSKFELARIGEIQAHAFNRRKIRILHLAY